MSVYVRMKSAWVNVSSIFIEHRENYNKKKNYTRIDQIREREEKEKDVYIYVIDPRGWRSRDLNDRTQEDQKNMSAVRTSREKNVEYKLYQQQSN
jgi:hypothetical protein